MSDFFKTIRRLGIILAIASVFFTYGCTAVPSDPPAEISMEQSPASVTISSSTSSDDAAKQDTSAISSDVPAVTDLLSTPQDTIRAFAKALANEDFEAVLAICAVDEAASSYQLAEVTELTQSYGINANYMQSDGALFTGSNRYRYANVIAKQTNVFCASLAVDSETSIFLEDTTIRLGEDDNSSLFKRYLGQLESKPWKDLQIVHMENVMDGEIFTNNAELIALFTEQAARSGGDEKQEWLVVYACGDRYFMQGITMIRYKENWKINRLESVLSNTDTTGAAMPLDGLDGLAQADVAALLKAGEDTP